MTAIFITILAIVDCFMGDIIPEFHDYKTQIIQFQNFLFQW